METALAGRADILVPQTSPASAKASAVRFTRDDALLFPLADRALVIGTPHFSSYWLFQGTLPDAAFVANRPEEFVRLPEWYGAPLAPSPIRIRDIMEYFRPPQ